MKFSQSKIQTISRCEMLAKYKYVDNIMPKAQKESPALYMGSLIHHMLENDGKISDKKYTEQMISSEVHKAKGIMTAYKHHYRGQDYNAPKKDREHMFSHPLSLGTYGIVDFMGYIDGVDKDYLWEHKTVGQPVADPYGLYKTSLQRIYLHVTDTRKIRWNIIFKPRNKPGRLNPMEYEGKIYERIMKDPHYFFQRYDLEYTNDEVADTVNYIKSVATRWMGCLEDEKFNRSFGSCFGMYNMACDYLPICSVCKDQRPQTIEEGYCERGEKR